MARKRFMLRKGFSQQADQVAGEIGRGVDWRLFQAHFVRLGPRFRGAVVKRILESGRARGVPESEVWETLENIGLLTKQSVKDMRRKILAKREEEELARRRLKT